MMVVLALSVRAEEDEGGGRQSRAEQERSVAVEFTCASGEPWPALFKKRGGERDRRGEGEGEGPSASRSRPWGCCAAQGRAPHHTAHRHPAPHTGLLRRTQAARAAAALDGWTPALGQADAGMSTSRCPKNQGKGWGACVYV